MKREIERKRGGGGGNLLDGGRMDLKGSCIVKVQVEKKYIPFAFVGFGHFESGCFVSFL